MSELPALEAALDAAARRRYGRRTRRMPRLAAAAVPALLAIAAVVLVAWPRAERPPATPAPWTTTTNHARGFAVSLPPGWELAPERLTPRLTDPRELFSAGTFPLHYRKGECAHMPDGALESMGPGDAAVTVFESGAGDAAFPPRPAHFRPDRVERLECMDPARVDASWFAFADAGRNFYALVALGRHAPRAVRDQAFGILDRLRFDPAVRPGRRSSG